MLRYDLENGAAYEHWARGNRTEWPWRDHILALDLMYNALDRLLLHSTQWNYTATNRNDARIGDGWNQEDFSIYSVDQATSLSDPWSGGRALQGCVRPRPYAVQGEVLSMRFNRAARNFTCTIRTPDVLAVGPPEAVGSVFYVPLLQFPDGFDVAIDGDPGAIVLQDEPGQRLVVAASRTRATLKVVVTSRGAQAPTSLKAMARSWL